MEHFFKDIEGWFDDNDEKLYKYAVDYSKNNDIFVEIGSFKGRSASAMCVNIINSKKDITFYCVDTWNGSEEHQIGKNFEDIDVVNGRLFDIFSHNTKIVSNYIRPIKTTSIEAVKLFKDKELQFVYIDASHDYINVSTDLNIWYPKVKSGGILAGHDWIYFEDVRRAVQEFAKEKSLTIITMANSWMMKV